MTDATTIAPIDLLVIGGGVNGTGIARDAAGRGFSVTLVEMNDLASGTSSAATKLVHGGLRYLEHYAFRLVSEALGEREVLWASAPHIVWPLRFVLPHHDGLRPAWVLRTGLGLYDLLGGRKRLPGTRSLDLSRDVAGGPLKPDYRKGFEYSDCWVDDARLVVFNARDAADRGATILTRTRLVSAAREDGGWRATITDASGTTRDIHARMLVNAAGPWVDEVFGRTGHNGRAHLRLVKGSHIVTRKLFDHDRCYIFQNGDGRIVFAIPYEQDFTLIGTTDEDFTGDPKTASISEAETNYLCAAVSDYFARPVTPADVVWSFSGVRPLFDDHKSAAKDATRDYVLETEGSASAGALLNVYGGKLTTYRRLSEEALERIEAILGPRGPAWTKDAHLPGGDFSPKGFAALTDRLCAKYPRLPRALITRLARQHGTLVPAILGDAVSEADLGESFGAGLSAREVDYLCQHEWAVTVDDIVWRRTKLGLRLSPEALGRLSAYLETKPAEIPS
ncbi:glycerol-3-phosphate dehydrogenase [Devosia enhydra]|uniref:Glycerol-3-phosphate dehydrogenase n=1 Tax=Devosia enhydra TaxID=665118 RepID=A0A1K2I354_9HYPH|nr:glycerol-3-phosphate dehydrogenase [Devosia enhydra]SFZ86196.1 glycerol-3-phosphate dehydrogenase [Devosia enhydra]